MATRLDTYANFKQALLDWLNVSSTDFATAQLDDASRIAQNRVETELRVRANEKALSGTVTAGVVAVPADYSELKQAYVTIGGVIHKLERTETDNLYRIYSQRSQTGEPVLIARDRDNFVFGPIPADAVTLSGTYYRTFNDITASTLSLIDSASADYNALFTKYPRLYLYATLAEIEPIIARDGRLPLWNAKYEQALQAANKADRHERFSGSPISMKVR